MGRLVSNPGWSRPQPPAEPRASGVGSAAGAPPAPKLDGWTGGGAAQQVRPPEAPAHSQPRPKKRPAQVSKVRKQVRAILKSREFSASMLTVILANTVLIGAMTDAERQKRWAHGAAVADTIFLAIYIAEVSVKLYALRLKEYWSSGWNRFDTFIVTTSLLDFAAEIFAEWLDGFGADPQIMKALRVFKALKALRALRALRAISFLRNLQTIASTLLNSLPAVGSTVLLALLMLYVFAVMGVSVFREASPKRFGSLYTAVFTLFQIITLDDWWECYDDVRTGMGSPHEIHVSFLFFFLYIVLETFILINLFPAVIVSHLEQTKSKIHSVTMKRAHNKLKMAQVATRWKRADKGEGGGDESDGGAADGKGGEADAERQLLARLTPEQLRQRELRSLFWYITIPASSNPCC